MISKSECFQNVIIFSKKCSSGPEIARRQTAALWLICSFCFHVWFFESHILRIHTLCPQLLKASLAPPLGGETDWVFFFDSRPILGGVGSVGQKWWESCSFRTKIARFFDEMVKECSHFTHWCVVTVRGRRKRLNGFQKVIDHFLKVKIDRLCGPAGNGTCCTLYKPSAAHHHTVHTLDETSLKKNQN